MARLSICGRYLASSAIVWETRRHRSCGGRRSLRRTRRKPENSRVPETESGPDVTLFRVCAHVLMTCVEERLIIPACLIPMHRSLYNLFLRQPSADVRCDRGNVEVVEYQHAEPSFHIFKFGATGEIDPLFRVAAEVVQRRSFALDVEVFVLALAHHET